MGVITKTHTLTATKDVTVNYQFILADTEPTAPDGYTHVPELDIDLGQVGTLWAFVEIV